MYVVFVSGIGACKHYTMKCPIVKEGGVLCFADGHIIKDWLLKEFCNCIHVLKKSQLQVHCIQAF